MKKAVCYGGGVNSTALLVGMHERGLLPDAIVFSDVGAEKPQTYEHIKLISAWCESVGMPQIITVSAPNKLLEQDCLDRDGDGYDDSHVDNAWWGWQAATEQSQKEIAEKDARIAELELENKQAKEAIAILNDGKPLGEIVGLHTAQLQLIKIEALQAREKVLVEALERVSNDNTLWKVSGIGGQDYYAGKPPAIRLIDEALANVRGE